MKKVITPYQREEANFFSDFTGEPFGDLFHPPVELKLEFNYGSKYDSTEITLHLSDKDIEPILTLIQTKLNPDTKKILANKLNENNEAFEHALDARDSMECTCRIANNNLILKLLGYENRI